MNSVKFTEHQWPEKNVTREKDSTSLIALLKLTTICIVVCFSFYSCSTESSKEDEKPNGSNSIVIDIINASDQNAMDILSDDPTLSQFNSLRNDIHSLETLCNSSANQVVLIAPSDAAFDSNVSITPDDMNLSQKHSLMKNSIIFQPKSEGRISGRTQTYGGKSIDLDLDRNEVRLGRSSAKILKQVQLKNGNMMYVVDAVLTPYI